MRISLIPSAPVSFRLAQISKALRRAVDVTLFPARAVVHKIRRPLQSVLVEKDLLNHIRTKNLMPNELRDVAGTMRNLGHLHLARMVEDEADCRAVALKMEFHHRRAELRQFGQDLLDGGVDL
ncbi:hypothetical protein [Deinococcus cellulosilyticus]|uniref:Uncharacterized protein n=1 Tax=Deinococcus cellulosilyticus (strain DSM 18568 / NBRC 106333 / KACC 11606 / 5516J-15) TaxID=1223518 RepID=A0A511N8I8_DEIC1|nr:hypothetical protein [Deinococcus cellulosilyticus]GEM48806.1 hypothetical protein DC3_44410 [Deinococcus cellulosilyticus NBRC 106333 = KACC 11606]